MNEEREDDLLAFYYVSISISSERPRLGPLVSSGWEFGYRLHILIKAFLFNWLFLLLSHSVVSDSLWPHGLQHTWLPCPSLSPRVYSNSCPLSQWCHPTVSSSVVLFSCLQPFPASGSFPMSHFFLSCGQSIGALALASILPMSYSGLISFRIDWFDLLAVQGTLQSLFQHHNSKVSILQHSAFFMIHLSLPYITNGKKHSFDSMDLCHKGMSLLFNKLSRFVIAFPSRSKHLLISWLQSLSTVILEPKKIKSVTVFIFSSSLCHEVMGLDSMILVFWMWSFKPAFHSSLSLSSRGSPLFLFTFCY